MKKALKTDIFISYRRSDGAAIAHILHTELTKRGYKCFHDVDTLRAGEFNNKIYEAIDNAKDVIVVLSPQAFSDINERESWMQKEIAYALEKEKNIIPVMLEGFSFPDVLPYNISKLMYINALIASMALFDGFMDKLCLFLTSKPAKFKPNLKAALFVIIAILVLAVTAFILTSGRFSFEKPYPNNPTEESTVSIVFGYTAANLQLYDNVQNYYIKALDAWDTYLNHPSEKTLENARTASAYAIDVAVTTDWASGELTDTDLALLSKSPFDYAGVESLNGSLKLVSDVIINNLNTLNKTMPLDFNNIDERLKVLALYKEYTELEHKLIINDINIMLLPISDDYPEFIDYKRDVLSLIIHIKELSSYVWLDDEDELEAAGEIIFNQTQRVIYDLNSIVGEANNSLVQSEYIVSSALSLVEAVSSKEDVVSSKSEAVESLQDENELIEQMLAESKARLWEKFQPIDEDTSFVLWFKAVKFKTAYMYDEAFLCLDLFLDKVNENTTPEITPESGERIYNAAKTLFEQTEIGASLDGIIVWGFEDGSTENEFLKVGDIVTQINGNECHRDTDWNEFCELSDADTFTYLRLKDDGTFETLTFLREKPDGVNIGLLELTEQYD
jgi:hypothetical protein